jgi:hypothetical protein
MQEVIQEIQKAGGTVEKRGRLRGQVDDKDYYLIN